MISETILTYLIDKRFIYQIISTLISYSCIRIFLFYRARGRRYQLFKYYGIPGPEPRLIDGNLYQYKADGFKASFEFSRKYGKTFAFFIGDEPDVYSTDLEFLKQVFLENSKSFKERSTTFIRSPINDSILLAEHHRWKLFRKVLSPQFNSCTMRGQASTMFIEKSISLMVEYIEAKFLISEKEIDLDVHELMKATSLHMISNLAIELPGVQVTENEKYVKSLDNYMSKYENGLVHHVIRFPFLVRIVQFLADHIEHGMTMSQIARNLNSRIDKGLNLLNGEKLDVNNSKQQLNVIDTLIKLHHGGVITRNEIIGNAEAILFAGYETTSTTLSYMFWVLGKYPEIQEKLRGELMAHGLDSKYLEQVINETMRLYPAVTNFTARTATETVTINDITIPQGTKVHYHTLLNHLNPEVWPEPEQFKPERFDDGANIHPCAFAPFGLGERKCLGFRLAMLELKMIVCDTLLRYRIKSKCPEKLKMESFSIVLTKPKNKIILAVEKL